MGMYRVRKPHFCSNFDCKLEVVRLHQNNFYIKEKIKRKITNCFELPVRSFLKQKITIAANFQSASAAPDSSSSLILSVITLGRKSEFKMIYRILRDNRGCSAFDRMQLHFFKNWG